MIDFALPPKLWTPTKPAIIRAARFDEIKRAERRATFPFPIFVPSTGYKIHKSLSFASASSQYLSRTWGAQTNRRVHTHAFWVKRASTGARHTFFAGASATYGAGDLTLEFSTSNTIDGNTSGGALNLITNDTISDTTAWHHIVFRWDTSQATAVDRARIYLDGIEASYGVTTRPSQNFDAGYNINDTHQIGRRQDNQFYFDGKMADFYFIDGQSLDPSSFITGTGAGTCHPKHYTASFGNNGFWLTFLDATSTTTLGRDDAGGNPGGAAGANDWTLNNMMTGNSSTDVPT